MTTLAVMKQRIANELDRTDLADAIAAEIGSAINFHRFRRFFFNERRTALVFNTAAGQADYEAAAHASIPHILDIDSVTLARDGSTTSLHPIDQERMERLLGAVSSGQSRPSRYSYYAQALRLYPVPDGVYPIRVAGVFRVAAPVTDDEAGNPWMTDAEELIRSRAKKNLYASWMEGSDTAKAQVMDALEQGALEALLAETSRRTSFRRFEPDNL